MQKQAPGRRKTYEVQRKAVESISFTDQAQETQVPEQFYATGEILRQAKFFREVSLPVRCCNFSGPLATRRSSGS